MSNFAYLEYYVEFSSINTNNATFMTQISDLQLLLVSLGDVDVYLVIMNNDKFRLRHES